MTISPRVHIIQISVPDMDAAVAWYRDTLGLAVASRRHYPVAVDLDHRGDCRLILHEAERPARIDYPRVAQTLVGFQADDLEQAMAALRQKGVELLHEQPQRFPEGRFVAFRDPFGNVHELVEIGR